jgi:hypothetical protein
VCVCGCLTDTHACMAWALDESHFAVAAAVAAVVVVWCRDCNR